MIEGVEIKLHSCQYWASIVHPICYKAGLVREYS